MRFLLFILLHFLLEKSVRIKGFTAVLRHVARLIYHIAIEMLRYFDVMHCGNSFATVAYKLHIKFLLCAFCGILMKAELSISIYFLSINLVMPSYIYLIQCNIERAQCKILNTVRIKRSHVIMHDVAFKNSYLHKYCSVPYIIVFHRLTYRQERKKSLHQMI